MIYSYFNIANNVQELMTTNELIVEETLTNNSLKVYLNDELMTVLPSNGTPIFGNNITQNTTITYYDEVDDILYLSQNTTANLSNFDLIKLGSETEISNIIFMPFATVIDANTEPPDFIHTPYSGNVYTRILETRNMWLNAPEQSDRFLYSLYTDNLDGTHSLRAGNIATDPDGSQYLVFNTLTGQSVFANGAAEVQQTIQSIKDVFFSPINITQLVQQGYSSLMTLILNVTVVDDYLYRANTANNESSSNTANTTS